MGRRRTCKSTDGMHICMEAGQLQLRDTNVPRADSEGCRAKNRCEQLRGYPSLALLPPHWDTPGHAYAWTRNRASGSRQHPDRRTRPTPRNIIARRRSSAAVQIWGNTCWHKTGQSHCAQRSASCGSDVYTYRFSCPGACHGTCTASATLKQQFVAEEQAITAKE